IPGTGQSLLVFLLLSYGIDCTPHRTMQSPRAQSSLSVSSSFYGYLIIIIVSYLGDFPSPFTHFSVHSNLNRSKNSHIRSFAFTYFDGSSAHAGRSVEPGHE